MHLALSVVACVLSHDGATEQMLNARFKSMPAISSGYAMVVTYFYNGLLILKTSLMVSKLLLRMI